MPEPLSIYDRPSVALARLMEGDLEGAGLAAVAPQKLSPKKRRNVWESSPMFRDLKRQAKTNPFLRGMMSVVTDPFVLVTFGLSTRWPIVAADKMFLVGKKYGGYLKKVGFLEGLFARADKLFAGTPIPRLMSRIHEMAEGHSMTWRGKVSGYMEEFRKKTGDYITHKEGIQLAAKISKLDSRKMMMGSHMEKGRIVFDFADAPLYAKKIVFGTDVRGRALQTLYTRLGAPDVVNAAGELVKPGGFFAQYYRKVVGPLQQTTAGQKKIQGALFEGVVPGSGKVSEGYFPQTMIRSTADDLQRGLAIKEMGNGDPRRYQTLMETAGRNVMTRNVVTRFGTAMPDLTEAAIGGDLNKSVVKQLLAYKKRRVGVLTGTGSPLTGADKNTQDVFNGIFTATSRERVPSAKTLRQLQAQGADMAGPNRDLGIQRFKRLEKWFNDNMMSMDANPDARNQIESLLHQGPGKLAEARAVAVDAITDLTRTRRYTLALQPVIENYIYSAAKPVAMHLKKVDKGMFNEFNKVRVGVDNKKIPAMDTTIPEGMSLGDAIHSAADKLADPAAKNIMKSDYMPMLNGQLTLGQASAMARWSNLKLKAVDILGTKWAQKFVPAKVRKQLTGMLLQDRGPLGYLNAQGKIASYFYYSTLGFNPGSAFQNLLQTVITTGPMVGMKHLGAGIAGTTKKLSGPNGYFSLRAGGLPEGEAFAKAFPQFAKAGLAPDPMSQAILRNSLGEMWSTAGKLRPLGVGGKGAQTIESVKKAAMALFSKTEQWNRLITFEAGLAKGRAGGLSGTKLLDYATDVVRATQFPAGPAEMPRILSKLPAPWRQFMYFPIRYAGFLGESTLYGGANKRNFGTLLRSAGSSAAAYQFLKNAAGADVSKSLMFGALPIPDDWTASPFHPMPVVPPVLSLMGGAAQSAVTGDPSHFGRVAPLLVPGGISGRRIYRTLAPRYAGYKERTADGRIPTYGKNGAVVGYATPMELFMKASGIQPSSMVTEREMTSYLLKQRDGIRDFRRRYVDAFMGGNPEEAQRINTQFQKTFPELGHLYLKKTDIAAARDRKRITRLQRLMKTMPRDYRRPYADLVNTAMGSYTFNMLGDGRGEPAPLPPSHWNGVRNQPLNAGYGTGGVPSFSMPGVGF